jgi:hypothetical protein
MDDPQNIPGPVPSEEPVAPGPVQEATQSADAGPDNVSDFVPAPVLNSILDRPVEFQNAMVQRRESAGDFQDYAAAAEEAALQRRSFRHNLFLLLSLVLSAFILTAWILVRVDSPFGLFSTGPQEIVRAQLRDLDRGELRPAYDLFSPRYRGQVSFDTWHQLFVAHWRMFHADVVRAETPDFSGPGASLEIYLHGADGKDYRARFTLIRTDGRWWIDDVHWTQEPDARNFSRI